MNSAVAVKLLEFIERYLGQHGTGDTVGNRGQCVGLVEVWIDINGYPHIPGNAVDLLANAERSRYTYVENKPMNYPLAGAIVCWDATWGDGYGHTAVVVAANPSQLVVFEQNNPSYAAPQVETHGYSGVAGWLVFK